MVLAISYAFCAILFVLLPLSIAAGSHEVQRTNSARNSHGNRTKIVVLCVREKNGLEVLLVKGNWKTTSSSHQETQKKEYYVMPGGKINESEQEVGKKRVKERFPQEEHDDQKIYEEAFKLAVIRELNEETVYTSDSVDLIYVGEYAGKTDREESETGGDENDALFKTNNKPVKDISVYILQDCRLMKDEEKPNINFDNVIHTPTNSKGKNVVTKEFQARETKWMNEKDAMQKVKESQKIMLSHAIKMAKSLFKNQKTGERKIKPQKISKALIQNKNSTIITEKMTTMKKILDITFTISPKLTNKITIKSLIHHFLKTVRSIFENLNSLQKNCNSFTHICQPHTFHCFVNFLYIFHDLNQ